MTASALFENPPKDSSSIDPAQLEEIINLQGSILAETITSTDCTGLLEKLCLTAEKLTSDAVASVMTYDEDKQQLFVQAAPSIPEDAIHDLSGLRVGDGSCGNAVYHREEMYVCNTLDDRRWENIRDFAETYKINACWSSPILDSNNDPVGSFALSSFETRRPDNFQRRLLKSCASIAGIILQRKQALDETMEWEEKLQKSNESLSVTLDSIADGVISTDIEGTIIIFNNVAEQLTGWPAVRAIGRNIDDVFKVFDDEGNLSDTMKCIKDRTYHDREFDDIQLHATDGTIRDIIKNIAAVQDTAGETSGIVVAFRDVTQKRAESAKLIASENRYRSIVENSSDVMLIHNDQGEILDVNQMACENMGYTRDELLSMTIDEIEMCVPDQDHFKRFAENLELDNTVTETGIHRRKDGTQFPVEIRVRRYTSEDGALICALARDVTARKKAEKDMLKASKLESIGVLAGGIAHDFNNLLGSIMGNINLAKHDTGTNLQVASYLDKAENASKRAADLTQQLLTFSKGGDPVKQTTNISEIIEQSVDFSMHGSHIKVQLDIADDLWMAELDSGQISQVIQNLVINARQAMPDEGVLTIGCENLSIAPRESSINLEAGDYIVIKVTDTGIGIPDSIINTVFDPYFTTKQDGSGLGLALSYSIVTKHNGTILVESEPGEGTTFTIIIPASVACHDSEHNYGAGGDRLSGESLVLVMDDDEMIREVCSDMLECQGHRVVTAKDGEEAVRIYKEKFEAGEKIDLLIMDLTVPAGLGGREALDRIMQFDPDVTAIVSSGYSNDPVMANYSDYGFKDAVSKPYTNDVLSAAVSAVLTD